MCETRLSLMSYHLGDGRKNYCKIPIMTLKGVSQSLAQPLQGGRVFKDDEGVPPDPSPCCGASGGTWRGGFIHL